MTDDPPTFGQALAVARIATRRLDESNIYDPDRREIVANFHAAHLEVRRAIYRAYPDLYGNPG